MMHQVERFFLRYFSLFMGAIACIGLVLGISLSASATGEVATGVIDYQAIAPLEQAMPFPMRLPRILVYENNLASAGQFFATGGVTTDANEQWTTGYNISILDSPNCGGGLICTIAYASAEVVTPDRSSIEIEYAWMAQPGGLDGYLERANHLPAWVSLTQDKSVYLVPWVNGGAGMGYEQAVWDESTTVGVIRYTVGLKGGDPDWLLQMVRSIWSGMQEV